MPTVQLKHSFGEPTLMGPGGAPKGAPQRGPHPTFTEMRLVWYQSIRLDAYSSFATFVRRTDPHGASWGPLEPQREPQMGPSPDFHRNTPCMVSIDSSRFILFIYNILVENRSSWGPRETQRAPQMGPHPTFTETLYDINEFPLDVYSSFTTFIWILDPQGGPRPK